jgi:hypothetical protein
MAGEHSTPDLSGRESATPSPVNLGAIVVAATPAHPPRRRPSIPSPVQVVKALREAKSLRDFLSRILLKDTVAASYSIELKDTSSGSLTALPGWEAVLENFPDIEEGLDRCSSGDENDEYILQTLADSWSQDLDKGRASDEVWQNKCAAILNWLGEATYSSLDNESHLEKACHGISPSKGGEAALSDSDEEEEKNFSVITSLWVLNNKLRYLANNEGLSDKEASLFMPTTNPHVLSNDHRKVSPELIDFAKREYSTLKSLIARKQLAPAAMKLLMHAEASWREEAYRKHHHLVLEDKYIQRGWELVEKIESSGEKEKLEAIKVIKTSGMQTIVQIAVHFPTVRKFCLTEPGLRDHWKSKLARLQSKHNLKDLCWEEQPHLSAFQQLQILFGDHHKTGNPLYKSKFNASDPAPLLDIFNRDIDYTQRYAELRATGDFNDFMLFQSLPALGMHGSAGWLACVNLCYNEIAYLSSIKNEKSKIKTDASIKKLYEKIDEALFALETSYPDEEASLHNATRGLGVEHFRFPSQSGDVASSVGALTQFFKAEVKRDLPEVQLETEHESGEGVARCFYLTI